MPKRDWKAVTIDWSALASYDDIDPDNVCLTQRQVAVIKACLIPAYWQTRWTNFTGTPNELYSLVAGIDQALNVECSTVGIQDVRQNPDCNLEKLENGVWTQFADLTLCVSPTDAGNDYYLQLNLNHIQSNLFLTMYIPGDPLSININTVVVTFDTDQSGNPDPDRETALCMAAQAYVGAYCARKIQELDRYYLGVFLILAGIVIITGGIGLLAGMAVLGAALLPSWDYNQTRAALADTAAQQAVACCMNAGLEGVAVSPANFALAVNSCGFVPGSNEEILRQYIEQSIQEDESYLSMLDALGRAYIQVSVFGVDLCNCVPTWQHTFTWDASEEFWTGIPLIGFPTYPSMSWTLANQYWQAGLWSDSSYYGSMESIIFTTRKIISIEATVMRTGGSSGGNIIKLHGTPNVGDNNIPTSWGVVTLPVNQNMTQLRLSLWANAQNIRITQLTVFGEGTSPF